jgi:hypothetical protein
MKKIKSFENNVNILNRSVMLKAYAKFLSSALLHYAGSIIKMLQKTCNNGHVVIKESYKGIHNYSQEKSKLNLSATHIMNTREESKKSSGGSRHCRIFLLCNLK